MRNLIKIETRAVLNTDARKAIEEEIQSLRKNITTTAHIRLYKVINNCMNAAYKLGKIDAKKEMGV